MGRKLLLVTVLFFIFLCKAEADEETSVEADKRDFVKWWQEWNNVEKERGHSLGKLVYQDNIEGKESMIPAQELWVNTGAKDNNFLKTLSAMQDPDRIHEIRREERGFSLAVINAMEISFWGLQIGPLEVRAVIEIEESEPLDRPKKVIFTAETADPLLALQAVQVIYEWGQYKFGKKTFWIPIKITMVYHLIRYYQEQWEQGRIVQQWTLKKILKNHHK